MTFYDPCFLGPFCKLNLGILFSPPPKRIEMSFLPNTSVAFIINFTMFYVDSVENIRVGTMGLIKNQTKSKQNSSCSRTALAVLACWFHWLKVLLWMPSYQERMSFCSYKGEVSGQETWRTCPTMVPDPLI